MPAAPRRVRRLISTARMVADARREACFPFSSADRIRAAQERRLRAALRHARERVPYYRETMRRLGIEATDIRSAGDLARLPLLDKSDVQRDPEYFVSEDWPSERCVALSSGGSTGEPLTIYRDPPSFAAEAAYRQRKAVLVRRLLDRRGPSRTAHIVPPDSSASTALGFAPIGRGRRRIFSMLDEPSVVAGEVEAFRAHVIVGYGSYIEALLLELLREGRSWLPSIASYSGDAMSEQVRRLAADRGVHVLASYNSVEMPPVGFECEAHRGLHLNVDLCPIRLVGAGGEPAAPGESGEIVLSNLVARGTVLLNYRIGDLATATDEPCPCGRTLPVLSALDGRTSHWLDLGGGRRLHPQAIMALLRREREIVRYQVVQEGPRRLRVKVVPAPSCADAEGVAERLAGTLSANLDAGLVVESQVVGELPRTAGGKVLPVVPLGRAAP